MGGLTLLGLTSIVGFAAADPVIRTHPTPIGGGMTRYDVEVDFQDGLSRSGFVQVTFSGPFDAQSLLLESNWPDLQQVQASGSLYTLQGGTGGGSTEDVVGLAQLVVPNGQGFSYNAVISRNGQNFIAVPEPGVAALAAVSLSILLALARLRAPLPGGRTPSS